MNNTWRTEVSEEPRKNHYDCSLAEQLMNNTWRTEVSEEPRKNHYDCL